MSSNSRVGDIGAGEVFKIKTHTCNFIDGEHTVDAAHLFELGVIDAHMNQETREDMQTLLMGFADSSALWNLFSDLGMQGGSRRFEKRSRGKTKYGVYFSKALQKALKI
jgi:hypothetical protein